MPNNNLTITIEHIEQAARDCRNLPANPLTGNPKTQIDLPERILSRARGEASGVGVSAEVLIVALLHALNDMDERVKIELANELERRRNQGRGTI